MLLCAIWFFFFLNEVKQILGHCHLSAVIKGMCSSVWSLKTFHCLSFSSLVILLNRDRVDQIFMVEHLQQYIYFVMHPNHMFVSFKI